jgi:hypothetical protein
MRNQEVPHAAVRLCAVVLPAVLPNSTGPLVVKVL